MRTLLQYLILSLIFSLSACKAEVKAPTNCGEIKTHNVDLAYTKKYGLQPIMFSVNYLSNLKITIPKEGKQNSNYVSFEVEPEDSSFTERIAFNIYTLTNVTEEKLDKSLRGLLKSAEGLLEFAYDLKNVKMGVRKIGEQEVYTLEALGKYKYEDQGNETFLIRTTLHSKTPLSENGLMVIQITSGDGPIKSHDDFNKKGCTSYVYNTLSFD